MINKREKIVATLSTIPVSDLVLILDDLRSALEVGAHVNIGDDFEQVDVPDSSMLTQDGREVLWINGSAYALRPDVHARRIADSLAAAKAHEINKQRAQSAADRELIAAMTCPQMVEGKPCGGALNRKGVCPSCVTGRMGYKYRYTCESCGFDIATKTEFAE